MTRTIRLTDLKDRPDELLRPDYESVTDQYGPERSYLTAARRIFERRGLRMDTTTGAIRDDYDGPHMDSAGTRSWLEELDECAAAGFTVADCAFHYFEILIRTLASNKCKTDLLQRELKMMDPETDECAGHAAPDRRGEVAPFGRG